LFTGIVEDVGCIARLESLAEGQRLWVETALGPWKLGESISISGACMTVVSSAGGAFAVDVSAESLRRTTLGSLAAGDRVNLERAMQLGDRLGGHFVSGHVDGTATVDAIRGEGESSIFTFRIDASLMPMLIEKGSVAIDGISLTCFHLGDERFDVAVIPHTQNVTTLGERKPGARVNIEVDLLGKYVARLVETSLASRVAESAPARTGK
jgi:riboflavin synthase